MKKRVKIVITSITLAFLLFAHCKTDYEYVPRYAIVENSEEYFWRAKYRFGYVYIITDKEDIDKLSLEDKDVVILDDRSAPDPNVRVFSSYKITDKLARNDIIEILDEYERMFPSDWDRTVESMRLEWYVHNLLYDLYYQRDRTENVDFNNEDEDDYRKHVLNKILKI